MCISIWIDKSTLCEIRLHSQNVTATNVNNHHAQHNNKQGGVLLSGPIPNSARPDATIREPRQYSAKPLGLLATGTKKPA